MTYKFKDRDIYGSWTNSDKLHIEYESPVEEAIFTKEDLLVLLNMLEHNCKTPPVGWVCSREEGHSGPCAARPSGVLDNGEE